MEYMNMLKTLAGVGVLTVGILSVGMTAAHADETVNPPAPTFIDSCGVAHDTYILPQTDKVSYYVNGVKQNAGTHKVDASTPAVAIYPVANSGYTLTQTSAWTHTFDTGSSSESAGCASTEPSAPATSSTPGATQTGSDGATHSKTSASTPTSTELPYTGVDGPGILIPAGVAAAVGIGAGVSAFRLRKKRN